MEWVPDTSVRAGLFAANLQVEGPKRSLVRVNQSTNTFAQPDEYDFTIYTDEGLVLTAQSSRWEPVRSVLAQIFPNRGLESLELPPHQIQPIANAWLGRELARAELG